YRTPDIFDGKRVVIIGCGNSGAGMAVGPLHRATAVDISARRGYHVAPNVIARRPADTTGGRLGLPRRVMQRTDAALVRAVVGRPSDFGLPDPAYQMYESHPVVNTQVLHHIGHGDITPRPDVADSQGSTVSFADGTTGEYDMILLATGYHLDYPF